VNDMERIMSETTVLLVDDDADFLLQGRLQLEQLGCRVIEARSRREAVSILEGTRPDAAVIDLMMEDPDAGFTLAFQIKGRYPDVPVIMTTAVTSATGLTFEKVPGEDWIRADVILSKPVRAAQLKAELERLLGHVL
jgi:CheY-like chemotaxis protein